MTLECLQCNSIINTRRKQAKFCSKKCSNIFNGDLVNKHNKNKKICLLCLKEKTYNMFSLTEKFNKFSIRKDICKTCARAKEAREIRARTWEFDAKKIMLNNSKMRAKRSNMEFSIDADDIFIPKICPVLGIPLHRCKKENWNNSPSIDRIDNTKGYIKGNVIIVSRRANILKKDATIEELQKLASFYSTLIKQIHSSSINLIASINDIGLSDLPKISSCPKN